MCTVLFLSLADVGRSLQAWQQHGRPHSELLRSQRDSEGGSTLGGPLRYAGRTLIFWVQCQQVLYYYYARPFLFLFSRTHFAVLLIGRRRRFIQSLDDNI